MMRIRALIVKAGILIAPLVVTLALGGPAGEAAAAPILVDTAGPNATDCGNYSGKPVSNTNAVDAINGAPSNSSVVICPGEYDLDTLGAIMITTKSKVTIKRAITGEGSRPILRIDPATSNGMLLFQSSVTIDGLVIDASDNLNDAYAGLSLSESSATVKNAVIIGPARANTVGVVAFGGLGAQKVVSISNTTVLGYTNVGFEVRGNTKFSLSGSHLDSSDGGRTTPGPSQPTGIYARGNENEPRPTVTVSNTRIMYSETAIWLGGIGKASISGNTFIDAYIGIDVFTNTGLNSADGNKITGNVFLEMPDDSIGVRLQDLNAAAKTIKGAVISKNTFVAAPYLPPGDAIALVISANQPAPGAVTATVTGNVMIGYEADRRIVSANATLTTKGNDAAP